VTESKTPRGQRGASLIEVLMAVLIFSIGLIGVAGLLIVATKSNHSAYVRTQVAFLANNMADRMRANPYGLWGKKYNDTFPLSTGTDPICDGDNPCDPDQIALRDKLQWSDMLKEALPGLGTTTIACDNTALASNQIGMRPPYGGSCTMVITWAERGITGNDDRTADADDGLQSFTWVFQP
jgi:type IV pilus assembly protein PilV